MRRLGGHALAGFAFVGVLALTALVVVPGRRGDDGVDPRTGMAERTTEQVLAEAKALGDARAALDLLQAECDARPPLEAAALLPAREVLRAELTPVPAAAEPDPGREALLADSNDTATLHRLLAVREGDDAIAAATEAFFAVDTDPRALPRRAGGADRPLPPDHAAARLLHELLRGDAVPEPSRFLTVAARFWGVGRPRARMRWLLRAWRCHPGDERLRRILAQAYVQLGRLPEAFAVTTTGLGAHRDDAAFWELRADLATWLGRPRAEAEAREQLLLAGADGDELRLRLLEIYTALGDSAGASRHAQALAVHSRRLDDLRRAVDLALADGDVDAALADLDELSRSAPDRRPWRLRMVDVAVEDLRYDLAAEVLEDLVRDADGDGELEARLEDIYRRRDRPQALAALLDRRLQRHPTDLALAERLAHLLVGLGQRPRAERVMADATAVARDAVSLFTHLPRLYHLCRTPAARAELAQQAVRLVGCEELGSEQLPALLRAWDALREVPELAPAMAALQQRFGDDPRWRDHRLAGLDEVSDPDAAAGEAADLAALYPNEVRVVRAWAERASWAGLSASETTARERLAALDPDDADNALALAQLLTAAGRHADAAVPWRRLAAHRPDDQEVTIGYVTALFACGRADEALAFLAERATGGTVADALACGDALFAAGQPDASGTYYRAALELDPDQPRALLRLGQVLSWANDARSALPLLRRRAQLTPPGETDAERGAVHFHLAEALWADGHGGEALPHYRQALAALADAGDDDEVGGMRAKALHRSGDAAAAEDGYRRLLARHPDNRDLRLDLVDLLLDRDRLADARAELDAALAGGGGSRRALRTLARLELREDHVERARQVLRRSLAEHGEDAGVHAELARASELAGDPEAALHSYRRWLSLQPDSAEAHEGERTAFDRVATMAGAEVRWREVGADSTVTAQAHGGVALGRDARLSLRAQAARYRGRSPAVANTVERDAARLGAQVSLSPPFLGRHELVVGAELHPRLAARDTSTFAGVRLHGSDPAWSVEAYARAGQPWTEPAAAAGLEGRRDGVETTGFVALGEHAWLAAGGSAWHARVRSPLDGSTVGDGMVEGSASIGVRALRDGATATADRFRFGATPTGPIGPRLDEPARQKPWQVAGWIGVQSLRLRGDVGLPALLPLGRSFDYANLGVRGDWRPRPGLGLALEGWLAVEFGGSGGDGYGVDLLATWRTDAAVELTGGIGFGDALQRASGSTSTTNAFLQAHLRW